MSVQRPEANVRCLPLLLSTLFRGPILSLTELFQLDWLASKPLGSVHPQNVVITVVSLYVTCHVGVRELNPPQLDSSSSTTPTFPLHP